MCLLSYEDNEFLFKMSSPILHSVHIQSDNLFTKYLIVYN